MHARVRRASLNDFCNFINTNLTALYDWMPFLASIQLADRNHSGYRFIFDLPLFGDFCRFHPPLSMGRFPLWGPVFSTRHHLLVTTNRD